MLVALQQIPLGTYDQLSEKVGLAKSVVYGYVQELAEWPGTGESYFVVAANPHLENLGLQLVDVLVEADSEPKLEAVERICQKHPYTVYRARCFGDTNGMLTQFRIPIGNTGKIEELFGKASKRGVCDDFKILPFVDSTPTYTTMDIDHWNHDIGHWEFNWEKWFSEEAKLNQPTETKQALGSEKSWLSREDIIIIRELTKNARQKNKDIMATLKKAGIEMTSQAFSRKLARIKKRCINGYRVQINPFAFDSYNPVLIWGEGKIEDIQSLQARISKNPIPFTSTFKTDDGNLFWYLHLPATHLSDLLFHLRPILHDLRFNHIDYVRSSTYYLWPETFNEKEHDWKNDSNFMIDSVLDQISDR